MLEFKIFLFLVLVVSAELNGLCNFVRGQYEEHFCLIIFLFDRIFLCLALVAILFNRAKPF